MLRAGDARDRGSPRASRDIRTCRLVDWSMIPIGRLAQVPEPEELLTVAEIAATLKMNQQTIRNWIDSGFLPAIRIGRRVRIKRSDFDRLVEESYTGPKTRTEGIWSGEVPAPEVPEG